MGKMGSEFLDFLSKRKIVYEGIEQKQIVIDEWLQELEKLYQQIEKDWLAEALGKKLLTSKREFKEISEKELGDYRAPKLVIFSGKDRVEIIPIGRFGFNGTGRINISSFKGIHTIVYYQHKGWFDYKPQEKLRELNKEIFQEIFMQLI